MFKLKLHFNSSINDLKLKEKERRERMNLTVCIKVMENVLNELKTVELPLNVRQDGDNRSDDATTAAQSHKNTCLLQETHSASSD